MKGARSGRNAGRRRAGVVLLLLLTLLIAHCFPAVAAEEARVVIPAGDSPSLGPKEAPVTIIKFTDYQ